MLCGGLEDTYLWPAGWSAGSEREPGKLPVLAALTLKSRNGTSQVKAATLKPAQKKGWKMAALLF